MASQLSEFPVLIYRFDRPVKLFSKRFGKELLDRDIELLREHNSQARVNVVLRRRQPKRI